ncbi:hypothetical protein P6F26_06145 [Roseibacterium sp. SDUM158017]|uniref:hypothetical protein n=1 Tax=Roseicyclus salinarum TaxID=3036773 RepID=UPI0024155250|nr:hypothetical protein [Roseibacterium sp. SDUM158017]MDG4648018.1 hypothetical protein [Roseibacterium sp. SDUM158017]
MKTLLLTAAASTVLLAGTLFLITSEDRVSSQEISPPAAALACRVVTGGDECVTPAIFQPHDSEMDFVGQIYEVGMPGFEFSMYGNNQSTTLINGIPFAQYWQLDNPNQYVFHPMVYGRFVFNNATNRDFQNNIETIASIVSVDLPNGGAAPYYPNLYPLNRMRGPDLMYSSISQSEILAGYMRLDQEMQTETSNQLLNQAKLALLFPYEEGGVDLGVAQLELPMFRSNPEIILNGWLHALLHLNDYAIQYDDDEVAEYVRQNLEFFVDNHEIWYDTQRNISRYSDTSPHRIIVQLSEDASDPLIVYRARDPRLRNYIHMAVDEAEGEYSTFDFRVISRQGRRITMGVTCSGLFETYLVSTGPFTLQIRDGGYSPLRASPDGSGDWQTLDSDLQDGLSVVEISLPDNQELICGYPTNFSKANGRNFYHMQHIVALQYLSRASAYSDPSLNQTLRAISAEWLAANERFLQGTDLQFEDAQAVLDSINRGKLLNQFTDVELLFE